MASRVVRGGRLMSRSGVILASTAAAAGGGGAYSYLYHASAQLPATEVSDAMVPSAPSAVEHAAEHTVERGNSVAAELGLFFLVGAGPLVCGRVAVNGLRALARTLSWCVVRGEAHLLASFAEVLSPQTGGEETSNRRACSLSSLRPQFPSAVCLWDSRARRGR